VTLRFAQGDITDASPWEATGLLTDVTDYPDTSFYKEMTRKDDGLIVHLLDRVTLRPECSLWEDVVWLGSKGAGKQKRSFTVASIFARPRLEVLLFAHGTKLVRSVSPDWILAVPKENWSATDAVGFDCFQISSQVFSFGSLKPSLAIGTG
jgi:hypothetical protein